MRQLNFNRPRILDSCSKYTVGRASINTNVVYSSLRRKFNVNPNIPPIVHQRVDQFLDRNYVKFTEKVVL